MSYYFNEYSVSSTNSINDNIYNAAKLKKSSKYKLKKMLKPLMRMLSSNKKAPKNICKCRNASYETDYDYSSEIDDNQSNETLETRILDEMRHCEDNSAIYVYDSEQKCHLTPISTNQQFVPVHFARTQTGTFFWTSMQREPDCDVIEVEKSTSYQLPQLQEHRYDRWVQA